MDAEPSERLPAVERRKGATARSSRLFLLAGLLAALAGLAVLYFFDPATHGFYPLCPLYRMTGLQCPGCGGLRALHQLLHGHLGAAWRFNPLVIILLPVGLWLGLRECAGAWQTGRWPAALRPIHGWMVAAALVAFGILRNLR
jgi:hypothetical protein